MKKLRFFDSLKFVLATVACVFILNIAHADNDTQLWKYTPLAVRYYTNSATVVSTESDENFNTYTVKASGGSNRCLYVNTENSLPANHKYFINVRFKSTFTGKPYFRYSFDGGTTFNNIRDDNNCQPNTWCNLSAIITPQQDWSFTGITNGILLLSGDYIAGETITIDKNGFVTVFDLTEIFGAGNEPTTVANAKRALSIDTTIKIATTRYNEEQFEPVQNRLSDAMDAVDDVVTRTMSQAQAIDQIANEKQTRPDEGCSAKYCLLVEDEDGTPHWYPIAGANGVAHNLPAGYTELQYIESTGTQQYINTGITGDAGLSVDMVVQGTGDRGIIFSFDQDYTGAYVGDNGTDFMGPSIFTGVSSLVKTDITTYWESENSNLKQTTTINGVTKSGMYSRTPGVISLFRGFNWGEANSYWAGKMFSFLLKRNGVAIRNFIPAKRNSDNKIGMYDLAAPNPSTAFYINAGTGDFVAGPDM